MASLRQGFGKICISCTDSPMFRPDNIGRYDGNILFMK